MRPSLPFLAASEPVVVLRLLIVRWFVYGSDCNNLVLDAPNRIDPGRITFISEKQKPDIKTLQSWVESDTTVAIAHVSATTTTVPRLALGALTRLGGDVG